MTGSLFLSPRTLLENSKVDSVHLHPFQCILFLLVPFSNWNLQKSAKGLLQAKEMDLCVMHGLFPVLIYFSFLDERKDRVEGGSLCSFIAELKEVHLKEVPFIPSELSAVSISRTVGRPFLLQHHLWPRVGKRCAVTQDTSASFSQTFSFLLDFHFAQNKSRLKSA